MLPFVSVLTPTYNRRPFISQLLRCFYKQSYPQNRMELIVLDDGEDSVEDLLQGQASVRYFRWDTKVPLGKKRNFLVDQAQGDIIVHMDDDDYYPPDRVSHAVTTLSNSDVLLAGSSILYVYDTITKKIFRMGPFGQNHGTNATFAYKRQYTEHHRFDDEITIRDEALFTENFSSPMIQLDPKSTMLCISHNANTYQKNSQNETTLKLKDFVKCKNSLWFYRYQLNKSKKT